MATINDFSIRQPYIEEKYISDPNLNTISKKTTIVVPFSSNGEDKIKSETNNSDIKDLRTKIKKAIKNGESIENIQALLKDNNTDFAKNLNEILNHVNEEAAKIIDTGYEFYEDLKSDKKEAIKKVKDNLKNNDINPEVVDFIKKRIDDLFDIALKEKLNSYKRPRDMYGIEMINYQFSKIRRKAELKDNKPAKEDIRNIISSKSFGDLSNEFKSNDFKDTKNAFNPKARNAWGKINEIKDKSQDEINAESKKYLKGKTNFEKEIYNLMLDKALTEKKDEIISQEVQFLKAENYDKNYSFKYKEDALKIIENEENKERVNDIVKNILNFETKDFDNIEMFKKAFVEEYYHQSESTKEQELINKNNNSDINFAIDLRSKELKLNSNKEKFNKTDRATLRSHGLDDKLIDKLSPFKVEEDFYNLEALCDILIKTLGADLTLNDRVSNDDSEVKQAANNLAKLYAKNKDYPTTEFTDKDVRKLYKALLGIEEEKQGHVNIMEGTEKSALTGALTAIGVSFVDATAYATATVGNVAEAVAYAHAFVGAWGALAIPASIGINMLCNVISSGNGEEKCFDYANLRNEGDIDTLDEVARYMKNQGLSGEKVVAITSLVGIYMEAYGNREGIVKFVDELDIAAGNPDTLNCAEFKAFSLKLPIDELKRLANERKSATEVPDEEKEEVCVNVPFNEEKTKEAPVSEAKDLLTCINASRLGWSVLAEKYNCISDKLKNARGDDRFPYLKNKSIEELKIRVLKIVQGIKEPKYYSDFDKILELLNNSYRLGRGRYADPANNNTYTWYDSNKYHEAFSSNNLGNVILPNKLGDCERDDISDITAPGYKYIPMTMAKDNVKTYNAPEKVSVKDTKWGVKKECPDGNGGIIITDQVDAIYDTKAAALNALKPLNK